jgi:hypothetical protein
LGIGDFQSGAIFEGVTLVKEAHAIVGRPLTLVSVAGVARRTTRRMIYATNVYVATCLHGRRDRGHQPASVRRDLLSGLGYPVRDREC